MILHLDLLLVKVLLLWMWMNSPAFFSFSHMRFFPVVLEVLEVLESKALEVSSPESINVILAIGWEVASRQFACSDFVGHRLLDGEVHLFFVAV